MTTSVIGAEMSGTGPDTSALVPQCPTDTSAPVLKCLGTEVSIHPSDQHEVRFQNKNGFLLPAKLRILPF